MSIWSIVNGTFLEEYESMDMVISIGIPLDNLYYPEFYQSLYK